MDFNSTAIIGSPLPYAALLLTTTLWLGSCAVFTVYLPGVLLRLFTQFLFVCTALCARSLVRADCFGSWRFLIRIRAIHVPLLHTVYACHGLSLVPVGVPSATGNNCCCCHRLHDLLAFFYLFCGPSVLREVFLPLPVTPPNMSVCVILQGGQPFSIPGDTTICSDLTCERTSGVCVFHS